MQTQTNTTTRLRTVLRYYAPIVRRYWAANMLLFVMYGAGTAIASLYVPVIYKNIIDVVMSDVADPRSALMTLIVILAVSITLYTIVFRVGDYLIVRTQSLMLKELAERCMDAYYVHSYSFYTNAFIGALVTKAKRFIGAFEVIQDIVVFSFWMNALTLIGSLVILWLESPVLGIVFLAWLVVYMMLVRYLVHTQIPKSLANATADSKTTATMADALTNILTIKMFGAEDRERTRFTAVAAEQEHARRSAWMQESFWGGLYQSVVIGVMNIIMIAVVVELWLRGVVTAGTIVLVQVYVISAFMTVWRISKEMVRFSGALSDAYEMAEILDRDPEVRDADELEPVRFSRGRVRFDQVSFGYEGHGTVLRELDLSIKPGERVAIVGHSGAGKTTFVKLLLRFVDVTSGRITIDGQNIASVAQADLRRHIAYVPQDPLLFHRSLLENIAYGNPEATREEVVEVARRARVDEFVSRLPNGYDTLVGERGIKLSGGERQRVAIARAMLKDAPVVVLDEATSSLDSVSERAIQAAFDELSRKKTTIVIAHRLSTIRHLDRILVLDDGCLVEQGTHDELLAHDGVYANLWSHQVDGHFDVSSNSGSAPKGVASIM